MMKILYIDNEPISNHNQLINQSYLAFYFSNDSSVNFRAVGKPDWINFHRIYKNFKPDLVIVSWVPASMIPLLLKRIGLVKCPIALNWDDYYAEMMDNDWKHPKFLVKWMEDYTVDKVDFITTVSKRNEKIAKEKGKTVFYIPHGVFKTGNKTKVNLNKLKTNKKNLIVIYLGDQSKWKRVDRIVSAVKGLSCDLFLIGNPNPDLQAIASENVHFIKWVDKSEVKSVLAQADILANTSDQDCNYKLFDYIYSGKVILAYDGLTNNLLTHKYNAYLTKDFREGMAELINNKELRKTISKNIKKFRTYTWEEIFQIHLGVYRKMISKLKEPKNELKI